MGRKIEYMITIDKDYIKMIINSLCDEYDDEDDYESSLDVIEFYFRLMKIYKALVNSEED